MLNSPCNGLAPGTVCWSSLATMQHAAELWHLLFASFSRHDAGEPMRTADLMVRSLQGGYAGKWLVEFEERTQAELDEILAKRAEVSARVSRAVLGR